MKKTIALMIIAATAVMMLTACGDSKKTEAETAREEITEIAETVKEEGTEEIKETKGNTQTAKNLYRTDKEMFPITMGTCVDGKQVPMVKVLVPNSDSFLCGTLYTDENGKERSMEETYSGPSLAEIYENGLLEAPENLPSTIMIVGGGDYYFIIDTLENLIYEDSLIEHKNEGAYSEDNYPCIVYDKVNEEDPDRTAVLAKIPIDESWCLQMTYRGDIRDDFSLDEINKYLCDVVEIIK